MTSRSRVLLFLLVAIVASLGVLYAQAQKKAPLPFPTGYRSWNHVKSMVIYSNESPLFEKFGGLHSIYVNSIGLTALQQGKAYPEGTVFVYDLHDTRTFRGTIETRGRKFIVMMKKNSKLYKETGGWGFEIFRADEQKGSLGDMKQCFSCHASQKRADYVYSTYTP